MTSSEAGAPFDPWNAGEASAFEADSRAGSPSYGPLAQWHAAQAIARRRDACEAEAGGCEVLHCLAECLAHRLLPPSWLSDQYTRRHQLVIAAHVATWDEAFGRPWPKRTRLDIERRKRELRKRVHGAVWAYAVPRPQRAIGRSLFDDVARRLDIGISGGQVERLYYEALEQGMANVAAFRSEQRTTRRQPRPARSHANA